MTVFPVALAVDGGQTSTTAIVATLQGTILGTGVGPACDHLHGPDGYARNRDAIQVSTRAALDAAGAKPSRVIAAGLGLTSAPRELPTLEPFERMVRELCNPEAIWVDADYVSNLAGASAGEPGVVVIAGGGSIGYGVDAAGREAVSGGLGYLMGDEGSGWFIGLRALQDAAKGSDRRGPETRLLPLVLAHFGMRSIRDVMSVIYDANFRRDQVSRLAPKVAALAGDGDEVARAIMATAGERLGEIALGAIRQLHEPGTPARVFPTGGVFSAGPLLKRPFARTIAEGWPNATIDTPRFPPVVGALLMAYRTVQHPVSPAVLANLDASLPAIHG